MLFLAQEKEKLTDWWQEISLKEIFIYFFSAFVLLAIVTAYYDFLGITGLFKWYRFGRNMGECFLLLFFTQLMTRKSLLHPFWRIGYIRVDPDFPLRPDSRSERYARCRL